jgi:hypothetical protein
VVAAPVADMIDLAGVVVASEPDWVQEGGPCLAFAWFVLSEGAEGSGVQVLW